MQMIQGWFTGGPSSQGGSEEASLLDGWKRYELESQSRPAGGGPPADLETGVGDPFAPFIQNASETMTGAWTSVSKNVQELPGSLQKQVVALPSRRAILYFGLMLAAGAFFLFLAFTMFLSLIVVMPQKFAVCFTIGCLFIMGSFFVLRGPAAQLQHMTSVERLPFTAFFLGSMGGTIYSSMVLHSYPLSLICSGLQVTALLYYIVSYFPGGAAGMRFLSSMGTGALKSLVFR